MADVYVNALTTLSSEPTSTDSIVCVNRNTNEGQIIDYNLLADVILNKITSKTYSSLTTTSKLLTGAINELDADVASLNSSISGIKQNCTAVGGTSSTITFSNTGRHLMVLGHASDTTICGMYLLIDSAVIVLIGASALTVTTDGTTVTITSTATRNANGFII